MAIKFLADATEVQYIKANDIGLIQLQLQANARIVVIKRVDRELNEANCI